MYSFCYEKVAVKSKYQSFSIIILYFVERNDCMLDHSFKGSLLTMSALFLAALCWGLAPVATRYLLSSFAPLQLVVVRFLLAMLFLLPLLLSLRHSRWTLREVAWVLFCGVAGVVEYNVPVTYGLRVLPSGIAGLLIATEPIWILLIAMLALHEKIS
jgi:drug/metabolite transporter (DMT)-like permease